MMCAGWARLGRVRLLTLVALVGVLMLVVGHLLPFAATAASSTIDDTSPQITWSGWWVTKADPGTLGGTEHVVNGVGASATLTFTGSTVTYYYTQAPDRAIAYVTIDGVRQRNLDQYGNLAYQQSVTYTLSAGTHTIVVQNSGTRRNRNAGWTIGVDAFVVDGAAAPSATASSTPTATPPRTPTATATTAPTATTPPTSTSTPTAVPTLTPSATLVPSPTPTTSSAPTTGGTTIDDLSALITWSGWWVTKADPGTLGGTEHVVNGVGASARLAFSGSSVTLLYTQAPDRAIANVTIDGAPQASLDQSGPLTYGKSVTYTLAPGNHVIEVVNSGSRSSSSTGWWVGVDAFRIDDGTSASAATATPAQPTATSAPPTPSPTPLSGGSAASFPVGPGFTDVVPHQIVRTHDDRLYIVAPAAQYSSTLKVYWTTSAGLPSGSGDFAGAAQVQANAALISADAAYDGARMIHVIANSNDGLVRDYPFDTTTNSFRPARTLAASNPTVSGDYLGTSGVSALFDLAGHLHVVYWSSGNHITHRAYLYDVASDSLSQVSPTTQVDTSGSANHPALAVSPLDGSVTVAWVSEATTPRRILARTRTSAGVWGGVETVSAAPVWTSTSAGINIDQGPSLVIGRDGVKHLAYIENWDSSGDYGRVHYVRQAGGTWQDTATAMYTHDPAIALAGDGTPVIIGHGHPRTQPSQSMLDLYTMRRNPDGTWGPTQLFAIHPDGDSFDASPSVKWSVVGFNRPGTIEFVFFAAEGGNYNSTTVYYGRLP